MRLMLLFLAASLSAASLTGSPPAAAGPDTPKPDWRPGKADHPLSAPKRGAMKIKLNQQLMLHAGLGDLDEVKQDLARGAEVNYREPVSGLTPLMVTENPDMVALLLRHGADIKATDVDGANVLHHTVLSPQALRLIPLLISNGAEINLVAEGRDGETPLLVARQWFFEGRDRALGTKVLQLLIKNGAQVNAADSMGYTLLMVAAVNRKPDLVKLMLALGADPNLKNREGLSALDYARSLKFAEIEHLLQAAAAP
jgi:ankyrin repeat protein